MRLDNGVHGNHSDSLQSSMRNQCNFHAICSAHVVPFIHVCPDMEFAWRSQSIYRTFTTLWIAKINACHPNSATCSHMSARQDYERRMVTPSVILTKKGHVDFQVLLLKCGEHVVHDGYDCTASLATWLDDVDEPLPLGPLLPVGIRPICARIYHACQTSLPATLGTSAAKTPLPSFLQWKPFLGWGHRWCRDEPDLGVLIVTNDISMTGWQAWRGW